MNIETLHQHLDSAPANEAYSTLVDYLRQSIERLPATEDERISLAYDIASIMSTQYALSLPTHHPLEEILSLAGELELPEENRSGATWEEMTRLIRAL